MTKYLSRWPFLAAAAIALLLSACSGPRSTGPEYPVVEAGGFRAQILMAKGATVQPQAMMTTTACATNVQYTQVVVPMRDLPAPYGPTPVPETQAEYRDVFWVPAGWNDASHRPLALYAHGYLAPSDASLIDQLTAPEPGQLIQELLVTRDKLLCQGYALGLSEFARQGYAVEEGVRDTHVLKPVFDELAAMYDLQLPDRTYVFGSSLGGLITVDLAETYPDDYDGAMPTCGPVAGSLAEFDYIGNVRLLFDKAYPGVLLGSLTDWVNPDEYPDVYDGKSWQEVVAGALLSSPGSFAALANTYVTYHAHDASMNHGTLTLPLLQTPQSYASELSGLGTDFSALPPQLQQIFAANALLRALRYHVDGAQDALDRGGGSPYSNVWTGYGPLDPTGPFVDPVRTYPSFPPSVRYFTRYYQPSGDLQIPTISLHTFVDPDVPTAHEFLYQGMVVDALGPTDAADMLRSFLVLGYVPEDLAETAAQAGYTGPLPTSVPYGHCNFEPDTLVTALDALDARATTGTWPALSPATGFFPLSSVPVP